MPKLWTRSYPPVAGREADVILLLFHRGPLREDVPFEHGAYGLTDLSYTSAVSLADDSVRLDGWRTGVLRGMAEEQLGSGASEVDTADRCLVVRAKVPDSADLGYLQAIGAVSRWLCARGALVVFDVAARRWFTATGWRGHGYGDQCEPSREVSVLIEAEALAGAGGHVVYTTGLRKFARPDLIAITSPNLCDEVADLLLRLAAAMIDGWMPEETRDLVLADGLRLRVRPANTLTQSWIEQLQLENDVRIVETSGGDPLVAIGKHG